MKTPPPEPLLSEPSTVELEETVSRGQAVDAECPIEPGDPVGQPL